MKKILSLILSAILLLATIIVAIPVAANDANSISATPITNWTLSGASYATSLTTETYPVGWTTAKGIAMNPSDTYKTTPYEAASVGSSQAFAWANMNAAIQGGTATHYMLYVKLDSANTILPSLEVNVGWGYNPALYLKGKSYSYAAIGDTTWSTGTSNSDGSITFDGAFEGFIKYKLSDLTGDVSYTSARNIEGIRVRLKNIGGTYGGAVVGPFFFVTQDGTSTNVIVPDEFKPTPIEATPLTSWSGTAGASGISTAGRTMPLAFTTAQGIIATLSAPKETETINDLRFWINFSESVTATNFILYVDIPSANILQIRNGTDWAWLKSGTEYQYAAIGSDSWTTATVGEKGIDFNSAFKGYIKFDRSITSGSTKGFTQLLFYFKGMGTGTLSDGVTQVNYGSPVVGPLFEITKDSTSTSIVVPEAYRPAPINVTAISDIYHRNYDAEAWSTYVTPVDFTSAKGDSLGRSGEELSYEDVSASKLRTYVTLNESFDLTVAESIIMYVKVPAANTLLPKFLTDTNGNYNRSMTLISDSVYYMAALGADSWTECAAVYSGSETSTNKTYYAGMKFEEAFEGFVKIPVSSLGSADETLISAINNKGFAKLTNIECKFEGLQGVYGNNAIVGPYFIGTNDSTSTELNLVNIIGDINKDSMADYDDVQDLRKYIIGINNSFVAKYGNLNNDDDIDICDLVYLTSVADDVVFTNGSYYKTNNSGFSGEIRTLSAYIYLPDNIKASARGGVILGNYSGSNNCLNFEIHQDGKPRIYSVGSSGAIDVKFNGDVRTGDYAHLVLTIDDTANTVICYIDGTKVGDQTFTNAYDLSLRGLEYVLGGDNRTNNTNYFKGKIGEVALFSTTVSDDEVAAIYTTGTAKNSDNLVALYNVGGAQEAFDIVDESGNDNNLKAYTTFFYNESADIDRAYSFAVVGDTQTMASSYSGSMGEIYDWILENKEEKNIQYVFGLGDIVDNDSSEGQWDAAVNAINKMNGKIEYSLVRGNHDSNDNMNKYFANETYMSQFEGFYKENDVNNVYRTFTVGETDYLFLTLEYLSDTDKGTETLPGQPLSAEEQDAIIAWADGVIKNHPNHKVIISTHYYVNADASITSVNDIQALAENNTNVLMVLGGHISSDNIVPNVTTYEAGHTVISLLVDPQDSDISYNGLGMVAMLYFSEDGKSIEVEYYSTVRDQYFLRDNQFVITVE